MPQTRATRASRRAVAADPRSALQARLRSGRSRAATACPTAGFSERVEGPGRSRLRTLPTRGPPSSQHEAADLTPITGAGYGSFPVVPHALEGHSGLGTALDATQGRLRPGR